MSTQHTTGELCRYVEAWGIRRETDAMLRQSRHHYPRYETSGERYDREEAERRERERRDRELREAGRAEWLWLCRVEAERNAATPGVGPRPALG